MLLKESRPVVGTFGRRKIAMGTDGGFSRHPRVGGHGVPADGEKFLPTSSCACRIQTNQSEKCLLIRLLHAAAPIREYYLLSLGAIVFSALSGLLSARIGLWGVLLVAFVAYAVVYGRCTAYLCSHWGDEG